MSLLLGREKKVDSLGFPRNLGELSPCCSRRKRGFLDPLIIVIFNFAVKYTAVRSLLIHAYLSIIGSKLIDMSMFLARSGTAGFY